MSESVLAALSSSEADSGSSASDAGGGNNGSAPEGGAASATDAGTGVTGQRSADASASGEQPRGDIQSQAGSADAGKDKLVPLAALHESREKIRALTSQIEELKKQPQLSDEDRETLKELKAQRAAAKEPKPPDFLEDPKGYIDAQAKQTQDALKQLKEGEAKRTEAEQQQQQVQQIVTTTLAKESEFVKTTPDYGDALNHLRNVRGQQLKMLYPQATDQQIQQQIGREELTAAAQILQVGGNPAEFAYNYAKTMGYAPKAQPATNGIAAAAAAATDQKPDKDAVRTLGGGGGADKEPENADPMPEFTAALRERFTRRRK